MNQYKDIKLDTFPIVGISVRTSNKNGQSQKDIGNLWAKFMSENVREQIPNKLSHDIYCVYTDYESDYMGDYTTIIGCRVSFLEELPANLIVKEIPASDYRLYCSEGIIPLCIGETWMHIWKSQDIPRKYTADFDVYGPDSQNPDNAKVYTYLSVN